MSWLLLLPEEAWVLVITGAGLALILGLVTLRAVGRLLGMLLLLTLLAPLLGEMFEALPPWASNLVMLAGGLAVLRGVAALFIGARAADQMTGTLAVDLIRLAFWLCLVPVRIAGSLVWRLVRGPLP